MMEHHNQVAMDHIQRLTQQINLAYRMMRDERHQLAIWEEDQKFSLLGEIELLTTDLQGYAGQVLVGNCEQPNEILDALQKVKPFEIAPVADWYITFGEQYPQMCRYLEMLDYLRLLLMEYLRQVAVQVAA